MCRVRAEMQGDCRNHDCQDGEQSKSVPEAMSHADNRRRLPFRLEACGDFCRLDSRQYEQRGGGKEGKEGSDRAPKQKHVCRVESRICRQVFERRIDPGTLGGIGAQSPWQGGKGLREPDDDDPSKGSDAELSPSPNRHDDTADQQESRKPNDKEVEKAAIFGW